MVSEASVRWDGYELWSPSIIIALARLPSQHGATGRLAVRVYAALREWLGKPWTRAARLRPELEQRLGRQIRPALGRAVLELLKREGLVAWDPASGGFTFPTPVLPAVLMRRYASAILWDRPVPVDRAHLRLMALSRSAARVGTLLVHLVRCSFRDGAGALSLRGGRCRAALVAELFGCSRRTVQRARSKLVADGTLARVPERPGPLVWDHGPKLTLVRSKVSGGPPAERSKVSPLRTNISGSGSGFNEQSGARRAAAVRTSRPRPSIPTVRPSTPPPPTAIPALARPQPGADPVALRLPRLAAGDLRDRAALERLHAIAARAGRVSTGPAGRFEVAALAQRALRTAHTNAPGLLYRLLQLDPAGRSIAAEDEEAARSLLRERSWADGDRRSGGAGPLSVGEILAGSGFRAAWGRAG